MPAQIQSPVDMMFHVGHPDAEPQILVLQRIFGVRIDENR